MILFHPHVITGTSTWSVNLALYFPFPASVCLSVSLSPCILASHCHKQPHLFPWQQQAGYIPCTVSGEWGGEGGRDVGEEREGGLFVLPSASTQQWERGEGERCRVFLHSTGGERRRDFPARRMKINRILELAHHMTRLGPARHGSSRVRGAVSAQRWCHDLFWGSDVRPLQWGWWCLQWFIEWAWYR